jgi:broad specificity phosphatase PhoE
VFTSTALRAQQTVAELPAERVHKWSERRGAARRGGEEGLTRARARAAALNMIDKGECEGMLDEEIRERMPHVFKVRAAPPRRRRLADIPSPPRP